MVAILVKPLPVVLLPLVWRHVRWPHMLAAAAAGALAVVAVTGGRLSPGSVGAFVDHFRFNGPAFNLLEVFEPPRTAAAAALVAGFAIAVRYRPGAVGRPEAWA